MKRRFAFFAAKLQEKGARNVLVSRGKYGATLLAEDGSTHSVGVVPGKPVNNVGCGDSMVAGFPGRVRRQRRLQDGAPVGFRRR
ncbi:MAG: PfkB family carbohydrate kinase [Acutalibacteraceae bacterium]